MAEVVFTCQFGERRKHGKIVRPSACNTRASGFFRVVDHRGRKRVMLLCASCAFYKMPNHVKMIPPSEEDVNGRPTFFRDIQSVELIRTLGTQTRVGDLIPLKGSKHWVEPTARKALPNPTRGQVVRHKATGKAARRSMDLAAYLKSLGAHDDGR